MKDAVTKHVDADTLADLFKLIQKGDELAFRELYERLARPLMAYCLSFTRDVDDAQDVFHQTMLRVYEKRSAFNGGNLHAWVFTIARNAGRDWERMARRRQSLDEVHYDPVDESNGNDEDEARFVQQGILSLPDDFRQIVLLRYFGDMSIKEIADSEGISESLVKTRLFRAREKLSVILEPMNGIRS